MTFARKTDSQPVPAAEPGSRADPRASTPGSRTRATSDHAPAGSSTQVAQQPRSGDVLAGRYRLGVRLGQGGMGVVFEAEDLEGREERVAVKVLTRTQPQDLAQLKNEFRALSDVRHPNLVRLHQLGSSRGVWFLVMDLVQGVDFFAHARPGGALDEDRLRNALAALLSAVSALHAAGKVHRDLKPSNVLVSHEGRVTVIDFGLTRDELDDSISTDPRVFVGTPAYAAPEQVLSEPCGPAADLYAIGVMLYEVLTGAVPFASGDHVSALLEKIGRDPTPPSRVAGNVPVDLERLALRLLARDPTARPTAHEVLIELGAQGVDQAPQHTLLLGRDGELDALEHALARTRGHARLMLVHGPSGIGKSSLLRRFSEIAREHHGALLFQGRCYAREQVPFKAFDALVEQIARHLARMVESARARLIPEDVHLLARVFPSFERFVDVSLARGPARFERTQKREPGTIDPVQQRDRAFRALKQLLCSLSEREPLILCLDDLQWGDVDSAALLRELVTGPHTPSCLFLCAFRSEERDTSAMLQHLSQLALGEEPQEIVLGPLSLNHAEQLLCSLLPQGASPERVERAVQESRGSPFLLHELARLVRAGRDSILPELVSERGSDLSEAARRLFDMVAVAARPVPVPVALSASGASVASLLELLSAHVVRLRMVDDHECIEPYHDRLREAVVHALDDDAVRALLGSLARAHAHAHPEQVDVLVELYQRAGELDRAAHHAVRAAELSEALLAFDRAADLYAFAIEYGVEGDRSALQLACAAACANAGRVREAGARYERAAEGTRVPEVRRELRRKAMLYYLTAGDLDPGERILRSLCAEMGLRGPSPRLWLSVILAWWMYFVYVTGPRLRKLATPPAAPKDRARTLADERLELAFMAARGLGHHSFVNGSMFVVEGLLETRRQRNPRHWSTALVWEAQLESVGSGKSTPQSDDAVEHALRFSAELGDVEEHALVLASAGARNVYLGRLAAAEELLKRAEDLLREHGLPVLTVCNFTRSGRLAVWHASGALDRVLTHAERWLFEARALGDPFGELVVHVMGSHRFIALDQVHAARESLSALDSDLGRRTQYVADPWWRADVELYAGETAKAVEICRAAHALPLQLAVESTSAHRSWLAFTEARVALSAFADSGLAQQRSLAAKRMRRLRRQGYAPAQSQALHIEASLAALDGDRERAVRTFGQAAQGYDALGFVLYATACRYRSALLQQASPLSELEACRKRGVREPERWLRMLAP